MRLTLLILLILPALSSAAPAPTCVAGDVTFTGTGDSSDYDACLSATLPDVTINEGEAMLDGGNAYYVGLYLRGCELASEYSASGLPGGITVGDYGELLGAALSGTGTATLTCDPDGAGPLAPGDATFNWTVNAGPFVGLEAAVAFTDIDGNTLYSTSKSPSSALRDRIEVSAQGRYLWRVKAGSLDPLLTVTEEVGGNLVVAADSGAAPGDYPYIAELHDTTTSQTVEIPSIVFKRLVTVQ